MFVTNCESCLHTVSHSRSVASTSLCVCGVWFLCDYVGCAAEGLHQPVVEGGAQQQQQPEEESPSGEQQTRMRLEHGVGVQ